MDRRTALKAFLGAAAVTAGASLLLPRAANALPGASPLPVPEPAPAPAVATEDDVAAARVENVQLLCRRNRWGTLVCRRRPAVIIVRRPWRRGCWINRFGQRVCRF